MSGENSGSDRHPSPPFNHDNDPESTPNSSSAGFNTDQLPSTISSPESYSDHNDISDTVKADRIVEDDGESEEDIAEGSSDDYVNYQYDHDDFDASDGTRKEYSDSSYDDELVHAAIAEYAARAPKKPRLDILTSSSGDQSISNTDPMQINPVERQVYSGEDLLMTDEEVTCVKGPLHVWIAKEEVRQYITKSFRRHLEFELDFNEQLKDTIAANKCSMEIDYIKLILGDPVLAVWLGDAPRPLLEIMEEVLNDVVFKEYPGYKNICQHLYVRVAKYTETKTIPNLRVSHLEKIIRVTGVVTRVSPVLTWSSVVTFGCTKCGEIAGPFNQRPYTRVKIKFCVNCQSKSFTVNTEQSVHSNYQRLFIQEIPSSVSNGRLPRMKEVILLNDLIDSAKTGEHIDVTGIYTCNNPSSLNNTESFPVSKTFIEANYVTKKQELFSANRLLVEDKDEILKLSRDPHIGDRIIKSIAPSLHGLHDVKTAIALAIFGGQEKVAKGQHKLRGDINVLMLGEPATAKSQLLKYLQGVGERTVYTNGRGGSAAGLTAAMVKDPLTRKWMLAPGALVLADQGICLIDELNNMDDKDSVSIHEAMEQQNISIAKAGVVATLNARCSVIAAANPIGDRYNRMFNISQNTTLSDPLLSRFDVICIMKDLVDEAADKRVAKFVVGSHAISHPQNSGNDNKLKNEHDGFEDPEVISQDMLKKYIRYAKTTVFPKSDSRMEKLKHVYAELRSGPEGAHITVRQLESMIRMAEASARMHLRSQVTEKDIDTAIRVMIRSHIDSQSFGVGTKLTKRFQKYLKNKQAEETSRSVPRTEEARSSNVPPAEETSSCNVPPADETSSCNMTPAKEATSRNL